MKSTSEEDIQNFNHITTVNHVHVVYKNSLFSFADTDRKTCLLLWDKKYSYQFKVLHTHLFTTNYTCAIFTEMSHANWHTDLFPKLIQTFLDLHVVHVLYISQYWYNQALQ